MRLPRRPRQADGKRAESIEDGTNELSHTMWGWVQFSLHINQYNEFSNLSLRLP